MVRVTKEVEVPVQIVQEKVIYQDKYVEYSGSEDETQIQAQAGARPKPNQAGVAAT